MAQFYYNQEHSITIGEKNTWKDWKLIPSTRPSVAPPIPKLQLVEIPGGNGSLDLTDSLSGYPVYENRTGNWEFIVSDQNIPWCDVYSDIMNYIQGKRYRVILEDDKYFYYEGRIWVNEHRSDPEASIIVIEYQFYPYKREVNSSAEPWLWDPFDFKYGVIRTIESFKVESGSPIKIVLMRSEEPTIPIITASISSGNNMYVECEGVKYQLKNGENVIVEIIVNSEKTLTFTGIGTIVSIFYRGGRL